MNLKYFIATLLLLQLSYSNSDTPPEVSIIPIPKIVILEDKDLTLPLKNVNLEINIQENVAKIIIEQHYQNDLGKNINIEYLFPISESAIFDRFEAIIDNTTIVGKIKEKEEAKQEYEEQVNQGATVAYTEIDDKSKDIMRCKIGNLLSNQTIIVRYSYIETLSVIMNKFWRLIVFSTLTQRYNTSPDSAASKISTVFPNESTYKWMIKTTIESQNPITMLKIPSHESTIQYNEDKTQATVQFTKPFDPNRDFELYYSTSGDIDPKFYIEDYSFETKDQTEPDLIGYITFFPMFNKQTIDRTWYLYDIARRGSLRDFGYHSLPYKNQVTEFIFVADRSGSMNGNRIINLKQALTSFLNRLPEDCLFNIVSFGSQFSFMYEKSMPIKDKKNEAIELIATFGADLGGTEIYRPLEAIYQQNITDHIPRIIYILTDGDVGNADQIIRLVQLNRNKARVCTIGIGSGTSNYLIKSIAKAAGGKYEFVRDEDNLGEKVKLLITSAISPYLTNVTISFMENDEFISDIQPKNNEVPFILKDEPFKMYFRLKRGFPNDLRAHITYFDSSLNMKVGAMIGITRKCTGTMIHKIFAKARIDDMIAKANNNEYDKEIIDLSLKYQVLSTKTAFLMLIKKNNNTEKAEEVFVPSIQSEDYRGGHQSVMFGQNAFAAPRMKMAARHGPNGGGMANIAMDMAFASAAPVADGLASSVIHPSVSTPKILPKGETDNVSTSIPITQTISANNPKEMDIDPLSLDSFYMTINLVMLLCYIIFF